jgi:gamma-D-glutamyl-L-lysine dipeptidyl-peptidase
VQPASCGVDVASLRAEPRLDAEQVTQALRGEPLTVVEVAGEWAHVRTAYDYPGWIRVEELGGEPDPAWLPALRDGSAIEEARGYLGAPYVWGGMTEQGIDCSGLVHMAYRRLGRLVPRDADQQEAAGVEVDEPRSGDLVAYGAGDADHVAFWLGDGRILHATGRAGVESVVEEQEPASIRGLRRRFVRLSSPDSRRYAHSAIP